jgi:hypothetical protein
MVLSLKAWKSRSLPGLPRTERFILFTLFDAKAPRFSPRGFLFVRFAVMDPQGSPGFSKPVERRGRWSLWLPALAVLVVILLWWCIVANASLLLTLLVLLAAAVIFGGAVIAILVYLVKRRSRAALSALAAVAIIAGGIAVRVWVLHAARYGDFAIHRAGYERTVAAWRAKNPAEVPFRMVLEDIDRSVWVVPTVFDYVVYDDSDAVGNDPPVVSGTWLSTDPANPRMTISGGEIVVQRLSGHFYFVEQTF